jgi:hypothetical protein
MCGNLDASLLPAFRNACASGDGAQQIHGLPTPVDGSAMIGVNLSAA